MDISEARAICTDITRQGREYFDAMVGITSHISDQRYEIFALDSVTGTPHVGEVFGLQAVYCREVYEKRKTVALHEINGVPGLCLHPLYKFIPCEMYISSPIIVKGQVWGTLNFTSMIIRDDPFTPEDIVYNEALAAKVAAVITQAEC